MVMFCNEGLAAHWVIGSARCLRSEQPPPPTSPHTDVCVNVFTSFVLREVHSLRPA